MLNDVKALCNAPDVPGLITFLGAYHTPEAGQINIILEYMNGGSLADVVRKVRRRRAAGEGEKEGAAAPARSGR
jgi:serine/threonine protein kinase